MNNLRWDVYISLAMHSRTVKEVLEQTASAKALLEMHGLTYYCPTDDEGLEKLKPEDIIDIKPDLELMEHYVKKDDSNLDRCRMLLVLTGDKASSGVLWECARMFYLNRRPIVLVAPKMFNRKLVNFTTVKADWIRPTQEQAISLISDLLECERQQTEGL